MMVTSGSLCQLISPSPLTLVMTVTLQLHLVCLAHCREVDGLGEKPKGSTWNM